MRMAGDVALENTNHLVLLQAQSMDIERQVQEAQSWKPYLAAGKRNGFQSLLNTVELDGVRSKDRDRLRQQRQQVQQTIETLQTRVAQQTRLAFNRHSPESLATTFFGTLKQQYEKTCDLHTRATTLRDRWVVAAPEQHYFQSSPDHRHPSIAVDGRGMELGHPTEKSRRSQRRRRRARICAMAGAWQAPVATDLGSRGERSAGNADVSLLRPSTHGLPGLMKSAYSHRKTSAVAKIDFNNPPVLPQPVAVPAPPPNTTVGRSLGDITPTPPAPASLAAARSYDFGGGDGGSVGGNIGISVSASKPKVRTKVRAAAAQNPTNLFGNKQVDIPEGAKTGASTFSFATPSPSTKPFTVPPADANSSKGSLATKAAMPAMVPATAPDTVPVMGAAMGAGTVPAKVPAKVPTALSAPNSAPNTAPSMSFSMAPATALAAPVSMAFKAGGDERTTAGALQKTSTELEQEIYAFYKEHAPDKVNSVPKLIAKYKDQLPRLLDKLHDKYNNRKQQASPAKPAAATVNSATVQQTSPSKPFASAGAGGAASSLSNIGASSSGVSGIGGTGGAGGTTSFGSSGAGGFGTFANGFGAAAAAAVGGTPPSKPVAFQAPSTPTQAPANGWGQGALNLGGSNISSSPGLSNALPTSNALGSLNMPSLSSAASPAPAGMGAPTGGGFGGAASNPPASPFGVNSTAPGFGLATQQSASPFSTNPAASTAGSSAEEKEVYAIYTKYAPGKLKDVPTTLKKYENNLPELLRKLRKKYVQQAAPAQMGAMGKFWRCGPWGCAVCSGGPSCRSPSPHSLTSARAHAPFLTIAGGLGTPNLQNNGVQSSGGFGAFASGMPAGLSPFGPPR